MWSIKAIDRHSQEKLYVQMCSIVREKIEKLDWPIGSQIPTEDELCKNYDVSKATVRMAIAELVRTGYLRKLQGKGTFVIQSMPDLGITMKTKLTENLFGEAVNAHKELLVRGVKKPPEDIKEHLKTDDDIYYILCKRVVNGEAAYLEESFLPLDIVPDIGEVDVCRMPFYEMMQQKAMKRIFKVVQMIEMAVMNDETATILKNSKGSSMLLLHRLIIGEDGRPIAYTRLMGSGRKYKLRTELVQISS
jgi:DNA-binding GntR family transcriptional regulator